MDNFEANHLIYNDWISYYLQYMGNQQSDRTEKKIFNIVRNIPFFNQAYRIPRAIVYGAKDNMEEVKQSASFDAANLNPLKCLGNISKSILDIPHSIDQGVWLGKRTLAKGSLPLGISFSPGFSLWHWAVMINGTVYQLCDKDTNENCVYSVTKEEKQKCSFQWTHTSLDIKLSEEELNAKFQQFTQEQKKYSTSPLNEQTLNCQMFVIKFLLYLQYGTDILKDYVIWETMIV